MQKTAVHVIPFRKLRRNLHYFDYKVSQKLQGSIQEGQLVEIPLGIKTIQGVVLGFTDSPEVPLKELKEIKEIIDTKPFLEQWQLELIQWASKYYLSSMSLFVKMMLPEVPKRFRESRSLKRLEVFTQLEYKKYNVIPQSRKPSLIKYVNDKKKFSFYLDQIAETVNRKKQILIIMPTIHDVYTLYQYLNDYKEITSLFLNKLSKNEFYIEWKRIKNNEAHVVVGTRSALFAPLSNIETIIIDQEDDENHKQEEPNPRYHVKTISEKIHELTNSKLFFVSNSPSIESLHKVYEKTFSYAELDAFEKVPHISIIDRNNEFKIGNYSIFSEHLLSKIGEQLVKKGKSFLFLNRKGGSTTVSCRDCGYIFVSPESQLPLTQYDMKTLRSTHGDYKQDLPLVCIKCKGHNLKLSGAGTEKVVEEIQKTFLQARILKLDQDTPFEESKKKAALETIDIVVGTSYALPLINWTQINFIGVISADTLLHLPDFRSAEKTFNLFNSLLSLSSSKTEKIIIQTFSSDHYLFKALKNLSYKEFYINEINERKVLNYPPFSKIVKLIIQDSNKKAVQKNAQEIYRALIGKRIQHIQIIPPIPAREIKIRGRYRLHLIIKVLDKAYPLDFLSNVPENVLIDIDPESLL